MRKAKMMVSIALAVSAAVSAVCAYAESPAPDFQLSSVADEAYSLSDYKGKSAVLLFFWTTWCPYCRKELNDLAGESKSLASGGLTVLAINVNESRNKVQRYLKDRELPFPVLLDQRGKAAEAYDLLGVPTFVLVSEEGTIAYKGHNFPYRGYRTLLQK